MEKLPYVKFYSISQTKDYQSMIDHSIYLNIMYTFNLILIVKYHLQA